MKNLNLEQMEKIEGGSFDCSAGGQLEFIAGTGTAGAFGGPWGFLAGITVGTLYSIYKCYPSS